MMTLAFTISYKRCLTITTTAHSLPSVSTTQHPQLCLCASGVPQVADHVHYNPPVFYLPNFLGPYARQTRSIRSLFRDPFHGFQNLFSPMSGMSRNFFSSMGSMMDMDSDTPPNEGTFYHMFYLNHDYRCFCTFVVM